MEQKYSGLLKEGQVINGKYTVVEELGKGADGVVYKVNAGNRDFAMKVILKSAIEANETSREHFQKELKILKENNHPNLLSLEDEHQDGQYYYLITQFCNGKTLKDFIDQNKRNGRNMPISMATYYMKQLAAGFAELIRRNIMHRDVKPANILRHNDKIIIADFGRSTLGVDVAESRVGSPVFMAPEILYYYLKKIQAPPYSNKCDLWSLGVTLYNMIYGRVPWEITGGDSAGLLFNAVFKEKLTGKRLPFPKEPVVPEDLKDLLRRLIEEDVKARIDWNTLRDLPLLRSADSSDFYTPSKAATQYLFESIEISPVLESVVKTPPPKYYSSLLPEKKPVVDTFNDKMYVENRFTIYTFEVSTKLRSLFQQGDSENAQIILALSLLLCIRSNLRNGNIVDDLINDVNTFKIPEFGEFIKLPEKSILVDALLTEHQRLAKGLNEMKDSVATITVKQAQLKYAITLSKAEQPDKSKTYICTKNCIGTLIGKLEALKKSFSASNYLHIMRYLIAAWCLLQWQQTSNSTKIAARFVWSTDFEKRIEDLQELEMLNVIAGIQIELRAS